MKPRTLNLNDVYNLAYFVKLPAKRKNQYDIVIDADMLFDLVEIYATDTFMTARLAVPGVSCADIFKRRSRLSYIRAKDLLTSGLTKQARMYMGISHLIYAIPSGDKSWFFRERVRSILKVERDRTSVDVDPDRVARAVKIVRDLGFARCSVFPSGGKLHVDAYDAVSDWHLHIVIRAR